LLEAVEAALDEAAATEMPRPLRDDLVGLRENVAATVDALSGRRARFQHTTVR
jgi:hypothetical protein